MRIIPQAGGDPRAKGAARRELVERLSETKAAGEPSAGTAKVRASETLSRYLARTEAVLQGFRALDRAIVAKEAIDVDALIASARFDGEEVLRHHADDLRQIAERQDHTRLAGLIASTENNARALLDGRDIPSTTDALTASARDVDAVMDAVVSRLKSGENPNVKISADRVADLLG